MKAFVVERYGNNDHVRAGDVSEPPLGREDVLVEVHAAGVNALDLKIRDGELKLVLPFRLPVILGNDVAGVVERVGADVTRFKHGDEVFARTDVARIGSFAEYVAVHQDAAAMKPQTLTMVEAASIPLVGLTAWQALVERANLKAGQKVLVHAGSGGVGTMAIQLAKHLGAFVATTTSAVNVDLVKGLGADLVVDYKKEDFSTLLKDYDVVLDALGGETLDKSLRVLKPGGLAIGLAGPPDPGLAKVVETSLPLRLALRALSFRVRRKAKRLGVTYSFLFMRPDGRQLREIAALIDTGVLRSVIDKVFPFEATKEALAYVETGRARGKIVVKVR